MWPWLGGRCGCAVPWWPSFMAVVEKEEFGVPLEEVLAIVGGSWARVEGRAK